MPRLLHLPLVLSVAASCVVGACVDDNAILVTEEANLLKSSISVLEDIKSRSDVELKANKLQPTFAKLRMKLLTTAKGDLATPSLDGWDIRAADDKVTATKVGANVADVTAALDAMAKAKQNGFIKSIAVDDKGATVVLQRWADGLPARDVLLKGTLPKFTDIKLGKDLQKYRVDPNHKPQPANAELHKRAVSLYDEVKQKQLKLFEVGHSQVVGAQAQMASVLAFTPVAVAQASSILQWASQDSKALKVDAVESGLRVERDATADKGAALRKAAVDKGFFLSHLNDNGKALQFVVVRKSYPEVDLSDVEVPATIPFEK